jgi:hypothetical protein
MLNDEVTRQQSSGHRERKILAGASEAHDVLTREFGIRIGHSEIERVWPRLPKLERTGA